MFKLDWVKTLLIAAAIVLAGYFIGNMHKTGKKPFGQSTLPLRGMTSIYLEVISKGKTAKCIISF